MRVETRSAVLSDVPNVGPALREFESIGFINSGLYPEHLWVEIKVEGRYRQALIDADGAAEILNFLQEHVVPGEVITTTARIK